MSNSVSLVGVYHGPISNYTGIGIRIGQIEPGVPATNHLFLGGQVAFTTNIHTGTSGIVDAHATQVAGVLVSTDTVFRGIAPGAKLYSAGHQGYATDLDLAQSVFLLATNFNTRVMNQSFSLPGTQGNATGTSVWERAIDRLVSQTTNIFVQTPGNIPGVNNLRIPAGSYNAIVVGAVSNITGTTAVADFSPSGPLADGRSKPDIVAPGAPVVVPTFPVGPDGTNRTVNSGTSFAAPLVAGTAARLLQVGTTTFTGSTRDHSQDPRVIKATLMNSATKLAGWNGNVTYPGGIHTTTQPLDPAQGAGMLNAPAAYHNYAAGEFNPGNVAPTGWDLHSVSLGLTNLYRVTPPVAGEIRLTLTWYRNVGPGPTFSVTSYNDLDILLWRSDDPGFSTRTLVARSISTLNNVEHLYLPNAPFGYYEFGVHFKARVTGTDANEFYGIAWNLSAVPEPSILLLLTSSTAIVLRWHRCRLKNR
ncbi:MAG: S8 family serine peptidase [Verrucomicrobiae bacterium]|nr:S8 family serine peptidase [Verrucomicrobiae bacterium]